MTGVQTCALPIYDGFSFSAGSIDYIINFGIATKPLLLIPIGILYALIYYFLFTWVIKRWNVRTPGREEDTDADVAAGGIDYLLNLGIATKPLLLIPIGIVYGFIYYFLFTWVIKRWNLRTPGREEDTDAEVAAGGAVASGGASAYASVDQGPGGN